ncbi:MAG: hypothetical protein H6741_04925 [Alphaproteobacteria bacterium]|nr:hypothetical protein [Alphaproteobacteria bacterium]
MSDQSFELLLQTPDGRDDIGLGIPDVEGGDEDSRDSAVDPEQEADHLGSYASLNSLSQGWGVLYPASRPDLRDVIEPLRKHREEGVHKAWEDDAQDDPPPPVQCWAIPEGWSAQDFVAQVYDPLEFEERPRFLLILGDFHEISVEFQCDLAGRAAVGRLCFPNLDGYRAYTDKLIANETQPADWREARLLLYSTSDPDEGDRAVDNGHEHLIRTTEAGFSNFADRNPFNPDTVVLTGPRADAGRRSWGEMRTLSADKKPSVLLSLSHGAGIPRWTQAEKEQLQGRVKLDRRTMLDPLEVGDKEFLPGGVWFLFCCFGAGTPSQTAFQAWLDRLYQLRHYSSTPDVRRTLAERPFVAATPMAALANPRGPLAVYAHADLAFSYGYAKLAGQERLSMEGQASVPNPFQGGQPFVSSTIKHLGKGQRVGFALHELDRVVRWLETSLTNMTNEDAQASAELSRTLVVLASQSENTGHLPEDIRQVVKAAIQEAGHSKRVSLPLIAARAGKTLDELLASLAEHVQGFDRGNDALVSRSHKWMARNDIRAFILLGDPAADLALEKTRPAKAMDLDAMGGFWPVQPPEPSPTPEPTPAPEPTPVPAGPSFGADISVADAEKLVLDLLSGELSPRQASRQSSLSVDQINQLERIYTEAGRKAIEALLKR